MKKKKLQTVIAAGLIFVLSAIPVFANITGMMTSTTMTTTTSLPVEPEKPTQKLPEFFIDLKDGLKAGTDYNGISVGEDMNVKETETEFQLDGETYTSLYMVQGTNNPKDASGSNAKGGIPAKGAFVKIAAEKDGVFTVVVRQNGAKPVYFVKSDASGTATKVDNFTTVANEVIVKSYSVKQGETYYFYASGSKVMIGGIGIKYSEDTPPVDTIVAVTDITGVPTEMTAGETITLSGTVAPDNATNKTIVWSIKDAGSTGATLSGNKLTATAAGSAVVTATIEKGISGDKAFTKDFTITVKEKTPQPPVETIVAVTDITGVPTEMAEGATITLNGTVTPDNATNKTIVWSIKDAGSTGATLSGDKLTATAAGSVVVTATIEKGISADKAFTKDFTIAVKKTYMLGDVDHDGKLTTDDALWILMKVAGKL